MRLALNNLTPPWRLLVAKKGNCMTELSHLRSGVIITCAEKVLKQGPKKTPYVLLKL